MVADPPGWHRRGLWRNSLHQPAVFVVAMTSDEEVALVELDRHTVGRSLGVPAGGTDGELPMDAAKRELLEEAGLVADDWRQLGRFSSLNGICEAPGFVFLALDVRRSDPDAIEVSQAQTQEGISQVRLVPLLEVFELIRTGGITGAETVASLMHAAVYDWISAYRGKDRPGCAELLADAQAGEFDVLLAQPEDRFTRQPMGKEARTLVCAGSGITFLTVNDGATAPATADGAFMSGLRGLLGKIECRKMGTWKRQANEKRRTEGLIPRRGSTSLWVD
ncbi:MAG TPA: NUDIX domain-containing protein [Marmoricola sp.]|nr:NUDIX domain-containing protein [Marmoricola sp.]